MIVLQVVAREAQLLTRQDVAELMALRILKIMTGIAGVDLQRPVEIRVILDPRVAFAR